MGLLSLPRTGVAVYKIFRGASANPHHLEAQSASLPKVICPPTITTFTAFLLQASYGAWLLVVYPPPVFFASTEYGQTMCRTAQDVPNISPCGPV